LREVIDVALNQVDRLMLNAILDETVAQLPNVVLLENKHSDVLTLRNAQIQNEEHFEVIWVVLWHVSIVQAEVCHFVSLAASIVA